MDLENLLQKYGNKQLQILINRANEFEANGHGMISGIIKNLVKTAIDPLLPSSFKDLLTEVKWNCNSKLIQTIEFLDIRIGNKKVDSRQFGKKHHNEALGRIICHRFKSYFETTCNICRSKYIPIEHAEEQQTVCQNCGKIAHTCSRSLTRWICHDCTEPFSHPFKEYLQAVEPIQSISSFITHIFFNSSSSQQSA